MTNPNPSPELRAIMRDMLDGKAGARDAARAALSQTLPAPGEVERNLEAQRQAIEACANVVKRIGNEYRARVRATNGEHNEDADAAIVSAKIERAVRALLPNVPLATVAAANDEGVARKVLDGIVLGHPSLRDQHMEIGDCEYVRLDQAIEAMIAFASSTPATVAVQPCADDPGCPCQSCWSKDTKTESADLIEAFTEFVGKIDRFGFVNALDGHATRLRAAIRLLSQGGGKA